MTKFKTYLYRLTFSDITKKYFQLKGRASRKEFWLFTTNIEFITIGTVQMNV